MNLVELNKMKISELTKLAKDNNIKGIGGLKKQELIFALLQANI
jgi:transcription termination factor Rho